MLVFVVGDRPKVVVWEKVNLDQVPQFLDAVNEHPNAWAVSGKQDGISV
jgi:hypothetical protein